MGRMMPSRDMFLCLAWLFICVLQFSSALIEPNYTTMPTNTTVNIGKSTSFVCGVKPGNVTGTVKLVVHRPESNYTVSCPGPLVKLPSMSMYGRCDTTGNIYTATWDISNIGGDFHNTLIHCEYVGLNTAYAYLFIEGSSKYYALLFGCVMGGFFGIMIVFGVTYVLLKRSEKCQECFKGKPEDGDPTVTETRDY